MLPESPRLKQIFPLLVAGLISLSIGCHDATETPLSRDSSNATADPAATAVDDDSASPQVSEPNDEPSTGGDSVVVIAPWDEIMTTVSSSGKPAVLDVWSLVCKPCLEEFPGLVRLHKEHGDAVACYSADVDFDGRKTRPPETYQPRVEAFLEEVGAADQFPSFISATSSDEIYKKLDIDSIPTVVVFAADGTIAKKFVDAGETAGFTYQDDVIPFVKTLIGE